MFIIKNNRADTDVFCRNCNSVVHKRYSRLKQAELFELKTIRYISFLWQSLTCMKETLSPNSLDDMEIVGPLIQTSHVNALY